MEDTTSENSVAEYHYHSPKYVLTQKIEDQILLFTVGFAAVALAVFIQMRNIGYPLYFFALMLTGSYCIGKARGLFGTLIFPWKAYFCLWVTYYLWSSVHLLQSANQNIPSLEDVFNTVLVLFNLLSLYGFAFYKRIFSESIWKIIFIGITSQNLAYYVFQYPWDDSSINSSANATALFSIGIILLLPQYFASFKYAFLCNELWNKEPNPPIY